MIFGYFVIRRCRGTIEPTCVIEEDSQSINQSINQFLRWPK